MTVVLRDLRQQEAVAALLIAARADLDGTEWFVDQGNPVWAELRGQAVRGAVRQARDYAAALGGRLVRVEHLADVGLLVTASEGAALGRNSRGVAGVEFLRLESGTSDVPTLDPVPQQVSATVEARFVATGLRLDLVPPD